MTFLWGLLVGIAFAILAAGATGMIAYRRIISLQTRARQAERLAELGTLTGGLAHEIKNPLSTVQLNLQLLREDLQSTGGDKRQLARLDLVTGETNRLGETLNDFLRYAGRFELDRQPTDLGKLLEELVDFFAPQAQLARVQIRLHPPATPVVANVDVRLIKQTVLNLMLNAVQAMIGGGELMLSVSRDPRFARIDVIDTGPGIAPEAQKHIFDAYYSTKKGGTGLGLAMSSRIAAEHGGKLAVVSELGKGSDFSLSLPLS